MTATSSALGGDIRRVRKAIKLLQELLAERAGLNLVTVAGLEAGRGTVTSLLTVLNAMGRKFSWQHSSDTTFGHHIPDRRRKLALSFHRLALLSGTSKPSLIQVEASRGHVSTLCAVLDALRLPIALVPQEADPKATVRPADTACSTVRRVIEDDCLLAMRELPPGCCELVITSPPYNAGKPYEKHLTLDEYDALAN